MRWTIDRAGPRVTGVWFEYLQCASDALQQVAAVDSLMPAFQQAFVAELESAQRDRRGAEVHTEHAHVAFE